MPPGLTPQQEAVYHWQRRLHDRARSHWPQHLLHISRNAIKFYGSVFLLVGIVGLAGSKAPRASTFAIFVLIMASVISSLHPGFSPHYIAPYAVLVVLPLSCGLHLLTAKSALKRDLGPILATAGIVGGILDPLIQVTPIQAITRGVNYSANFRGEVERRIKAIGGKHLLIVRYGTRHVFHSEWVYNSAEIDEAPVVWARYIDEEALGELTNYYRGRCHWLVEVDRAQVRLQRLAPPPDREPTHGCRPGAFQQLQLDGATLRHPQ